MKIIQNIYTIYVINNIFWCMLLLSILIFVLHCVTYKLMPMCRGGGLCLCFGVCQLFQVAKLEIYMINKKNDTIMFLLLLLQNTFCILTVLCKFSQANCNNYIISLVLPYLVYRSILLFYLMYPFSGSFLAKKSIFLSSLVNFHLAIAILLAITQWDEIKYR